MKKIFPLLFFCFLFAFLPLKATKAFSLGGYKYQSKDFLLLDQNVSSLSSYRDSVNKKTYFAFFTDQSLASTSVSTSTSKEATSSVLMVNIYNSDDFKLISSISPVLGTSSVFTQDLVFSRNEKSGNFGLLWSEKSLVGSSTQINVYYQVLDQTGKFLGDKIKVNDDDLNLAGKKMENNTNPAISYDDSGNSLIMWSSVNQGNTSSAIFGQKIGAQGKDGKNFLIDGTTANDVLARQNPQLLFWSGKYLLVWNQGVKLKYLFLEKSFKVGDDLSGKILALDEGDNLQRSPMVIASKDHVFVLYIDFSGTDKDKSNLVYKRYTNENSIFGEKIKLISYVDKSGYDVGFVDNDLYLIAYGSLANGGKNMEAYSFSLANGPAESLEKIEKAKAFSADWIGQADLTTGYSDLLIAWTGKGMVASSSLFIDVLNKEDSFKKCTKDDWREVYLKGVCPSDGLVSRQWFKINFCEGGEIKPSIETDVNCDGSAVIKKLPCTGLDWMLSYEPQDCPRSGFQVEKWTKITECESGLQKTNGRKVACDYLGGDEPVIVKKPVVVVKVNKATTTKEEVLKNKFVYKSVKGRILIKVEDFGMAYYISPVKMSAYYLGRPEDAFTAMRNNGIGILNKDLLNIPVGFTSVVGSDSDQDGLSDLLEEAIGTDKNKKDSDNDGFEDKSELMNGFSPLDKNKLSVNNSLVRRLAGSILIQTEGKGEAWYLNPVDGKRYFLGRPKDAFEVMRVSGLGISNVDFDSLKK